VKPRYLFPNVEKKTSSVIKKCLNPIYEEVFEMNVSLSCMIQPCAVIHFTVMDHDLVWSNDFEGEAFLELSSLPGVKTNLTDAEIISLKYTELKLINPMEYPNKILHVLGLRSQDKLAIEFLKTRKDK
jgi:hypothetical protein